MQIKNDVLEIDKNKKRNLYDVFVNTTNKACVILWLVEFMISHKKYCFLLAYLQKTGMSKCNATCKNIMSNHFN